ncbi:cytochrome C biogenesis protein [Candidatus Campbellbacteria bacterium CG10_big_fil_rev_8_21_14_0_10_35_52]|uniref:Cytochrome C biogenesis protein n=1 Tax=Candidatus Campbellbacteria bacterium CG10_big_fil_rev_8_21_14_0_10_35_52 TaxID=1974527 RepID=A0A2M6WV10_9BACT|nr:MAG: cytochrome C biogenesis protein [Candidatus Campbellbacteria bacterium CG10_big_fil_rev_8_21_14_0_10_35_52]
MNPKTFKIWLVTVAFVLFSIILIGLFSLWTSQEFIPGYSLSFLAGLSMIFLPCTFPLVFIIVPLALSKKIGKGLMMALLFGAGLTLTFTLYGMALGWLGGFVELYRVISWMLILGGVAALIFGISELNLIKFKLPFRQTILPASLQRKNDYVRSFFLGFFLGNAGVGCPNPAFYILFGYVATLGIPTVGASLGALHGLGRIVPLLFLVVLALLGINAMNKLSLYQDKVKRWVAWALVGLGAFIFNYGFFGMAWFEDSIIHQSWNRFLEITFPKIAESSVIESSLNLPQGTGGIIPWLVFAGIISFIILWDAFRRRRVENINL